MSGILMEMAESQEKSDIVSQASFKNFRQWLLWISFLLLFCQNTSVCMYIYTALGRLFPGNTHCTQLCGFQNILNT